MRHGYCSTHDTTARRIAQVRHATASTLTFPSIMNQVFLEIGTCPLAVYSTSETLFLSNFTCPKQTRAPRDKSGCSVCVSC